MTPAELGMRLAASVPGASADVGFGPVTVTVPRAAWVQAAMVARDDPAIAAGYFDFLTGVDETDQPEGEQGFGVVMHLHSPAHGHHLLLRTVLPLADPHVATLSGVFAGANWHERETWEMYGVVFDGHPNLTLLLLPDGFEGHPLRKEFILAARAVKAWPGAKEPGESAGDVDRAPARRANVPPGVPEPDSGWPRGLPIETIRPDGRP